MSRTDLTLVDIRTRFAQLGPESLSDHELVALLVGWGLSGSGSTQPLSLAEKTLSYTGGLAGIEKFELAELQKIDGLGPVKTCLLQAAVELGKRAVIPAPALEKSISSATEVAEWFRCHLQNIERECIHALLLDSKHRPIKHFQVTVGSWTSCPVDPKVVFAACLRNGAPAVILIHNHPSGDPTPSRDDLELTERMVRAGRVVGITVLDHLIVGREGFTSLADQGLL